ncbi:unnamed protein product [Rotaria sp. Silwood1]|nr:unnamed protein product [Rotaria sp. Silwood1]CAF4990806.1 unnamed protein product [Rotaria sp. Silwood1]
MQCKRVYPNNICRAHTFFCADAYIIRNSTVARKLINWSNTETPQVADVFWHPYISNDALIAYAAYPNHIAMQDRSKFGSDVLQSGPIKVVNLQNPLSKILQASNNSSAVEIMAIDRFASDAIKMIMALNNYLEEKQTVNNA